MDLVRDLPADLPAALFVVLHIPPDSTSLLPRILTHAGRLPAHHADDGERITLGRVYVAPPDRHLILERGRVRVTRGPRENRHRPRSRIRLPRAYRSRGDPTHRLRRHRHERPLLRSGPRHLSRRPSRGPGPARGPSGDSSTQVALFVSPVLVFISLLFCPLELIALGLAVLTVNFTVLADETNWYEGRSFIASAIIGAAFFLHD